MRGIYTWLAHYFLLALPLPRSNPTRYKYPAQSFHWHTFIHLPMKMEPTVSSETSVIRTQTPENYAKRNRLHKDYYFHSMKVTVLFIYRKIISLIKILLICFVPLFFWLCEWELLEFSISVLPVPFCYIWHSSATKWKYLRSSFWGFNPGAAEMTLYETSKYAFFSKYCVGYYMNSTVVV